MNGRIVDGGMARGALDVDMWNGGWAMGIHKKEPRALRIIKEQLNYAHLARGHRVKVGSNHIHQCTEPPGELTLVQLQLSTSLSTKDLTHTLARMSIPIGVQAYEHKWTVPKVSEQLHRTPVITQAVVADVLILIDLYDEHVRQAVQQAVRATPATAS